MKRFYKEVDLAPQDGGWQVMLDGRGVRSQGGSPQVVPGSALGALLAGEWRNQPETIDLHSFVMRDMADYAIDVVRQERAETIDKLLTYGDTDTLCYRADPDEPLYQRQRTVWEPVITGCEARLGITFQRVSGVLHRPQKPETLQAMRTVLDRQDDFVLAGLVNLASIAASLITALEVLETPDRSGDLFTAANVEEDWQAELWGWDALAEERRANRAEAFRLAAEFVRAAGEG
jgi:chaperone required for assembly of F1-ATPase